MELSVDIRKVYDHAVEVLIAPRPFFTKIKKAKGYRDTTVYLIVLNLVFAVFGVLAIILVNPSRVEVTFTSALEVVIASVVSGIAVSFFSALVLRLWLKLFKINETYHKAFLLVSYARTPAVVLGWVPIPALALLGWIYNLYVLVVGAEVLYKVTRKKAFLTIVVPILVLTAISIALLVVINSQISPA